MKTTTKCLALLALCAGVATSPGGDALQLPPLTTVSGAPRLPGKFVWADLVTDDVPAAQKFYSRLFGWTFRGAGSNYIIAANDERPVGGIFHRPRPKEQAAATPRWFGYISVASVDRAQSAVKKAGGRVLAAPQKMPARGEQAIFADAEGALFGAIKSSSGDPEDFLPEPGDWAWVQLLSRDGKKASEFYRAVAGYEVIENAVTNRLSDYILTSNGYARATVRTIPDGNEKAHPTWLPFVRVKSVTESAALAKESGGTVRIEPKPELFNGKVAVIADPTGASVGVIELSDEWLKGARE